MKNKKLTVLRTIESFYPYLSGPANQAFRISKELEKRGMSSPILTSDYKSEKKNKYEKMNGVCVFRFPIKWKFMKYFYTPLIRTKLNNSDVFCAHNYRSYQTECAYNAARKQNKPFILHNHGSLMGYKSFVKGLRKTPYIAYDFFNRRIALKADAVIVNTRQECEEAINFGVKKSKIHIIPFGIDVEKYTPSRKYARILTLLWVGRITRDRNIEIILKAVKLMSDKKIKLKIVGNEYKRTSSDSKSELKRLKGIVKDLDIESKVDFIPWTEQRANKEFCRADIFIYPSFWENLGQSILEAAAAGLPLICTRVGVALDLIEEGKTGMFVRQNSPSDISKAVTFFSDKNRRYEASVILRKRLSSEFDWKKIIKKYVKLYKSLTEPRR